MLARVESEAENLACRNERTRGRVPTVMETRMSRQLRGFSFRFIPFGLTPFDYSANSPDGTGDIVSGFRPILRRS